MSGEVKKEAPAPEGGAVLGALDEALIYIERLGENIERNDLDMHLDTVERPFSFAQTMRGRFPSLCAALATREEAPAEAGEAIERLTKLAEINGSCPGWIVVNQNDLRVALPALRAHPQAPTASFMAKAKHLLDLAEKAEEEALDGDEGCVWPVEALRAAYDNLAQPPAREDAQPVAWSFELATVRDRETGEYSSWGEPRLSFTKPCVSEGSIRNLTALGPITHPAPDALRVASLSRFSPTSTGNNVAMMQEDEEGLYVLRKQVFAALQAEQKGGAA